MMRGAGPRAGRRRGVTRWVASSVSWSAWGLAPRLLEEAGSLVFLFLRTLAGRCGRRTGPRSVVQQMASVGVSSLPIVLITAVFTGAVLALQTMTGFKRFNAQDLVGTIVALSICRELGPVLTGLIVSGRVGSGMAAELGTMKVTSRSTPWRRSRRTR